MAKQTIESPNDDEMAWIAENLDAARSMATPNVGGADRPLDPGALDHALAARSSHAPGKGDDDLNAVVNALGIAFGQYLVEQLDLEWAVVTDEHGTDLAVHGDPGDILIFPTAAVAKRVASGETTFFQDLFDQMAADVARIRRTVH